MRLVDVVLLLKRGFIRHMFKEELLRSVLAQQLPGARVTAPQTRLPTPPLVPDRVKRSCSCCLSCCSAALLQPLPQSSLCHSITDAEIVSPEPLLTPAVAALCLSLPRSSGQVLGWGQGPERGTGWTPLSKVALVDPQGWCVGMQLHLSAHRGSCV